jgi:cytoskeletal protein CcmA (bactofilin family)
MWNKRDDEATPHPAAGQAAPAPTTTPALDKRHEQAAIGPSISIVGDLTGDEDLTILGKVDGKVELPQHTVTIGRSARVTADIHASIVNVEGEVRGNLLASEQILIRRTATMLGNLTAPRVGLEDGCRFKGSVDMEAQPTDKARVIVAKPVVAPPSGVSRPEAPPRP